MEDHVVEFDERQRAFAVETCFDRFERQHPIDREVAPDVPKKRDVLQRIQPIGVVDENRVGRTVAERQKPPQEFFDPLDIGLDFPFAADLPHLVFAGRVADLRRATTDQSDGFLPRALHNPEFKDLHEVADMKARRRRIEADVADDTALERRSVERLEIGRVVEVTAPDHGAQEI